MGLGIYTISISGWVPSLCCSNLIFRSFYIRVILRMGAKHAISKLIRSKRFDDTNPNGV